MSRSSPQSRHVAYAAALLAGVTFYAAPRALASDWSARTEFRQSAEISDNRALKNNPSGETYGSISQLIFNSVARYPALTFGFDADISYRALTGPGADDNTSPMDNGVRARIEKLDSLTRYFMIGSWRRQDATSAQIDDTGLTLVKGNINTYALEAGLERQVAPLDRVLWSARATAVEFDSSNASSYTDVVTTGTWTHRLNPLTHVFSSLQFEAINRDDAAQSESLIGRATAGLDAKLTKQLSMKSAAGVVAYDASQNAPSGLASSASDGLGWLADLQLTYWLLQNSQLSFSAVHTIAPNSVGETQERSSVSLAMRNAINRWSNLALSAEASRHILLDASANLVGTSLDYGTADLLRASATYGYRLTPDWTTEVSYRFIHRTDDTGSAHSNTVYLTLVRNFTLMP